MWYVIFLGKVIPFQSNMSCLSWINLIRVEKWFNFALKFKFFANIIVYHRKRNRRDIREVTIFCIHLHFIAETRFPVFQSPSSLIVSIYLGWILNFCVECRCQKVVFAFLSCLHTLFKRCNWHQTKALLRNLSTEFKVGKWFVSLSVTLIGNVVEWRKKKIFLIHKSVSHR